MTSASVLCAYDGCFGAGLLEALTQVAVDQARCLLLTCDTPYPEPLHSTRPILDAMGIALALAPERSEKSIAQITINLCDANADVLDNAALEALRTSIPAARGLPLLAALARRQNTRVVLDYLDNTRLAVEIAIC